MTRLTDKKLWDNLYEKTAKKQHMKSGASYRGLRKHFRQYSDYLLWDVIFKKYLPKREGAKILEVGSAPGDFLVTAYKKYRFEPYGVEYSERGVIQNKELFSLNNISTKNVIHADFFDDDFQQDYKEYFDIVVSRGFIEHFTNVEEVIDRHLNVLVKEGCLVVSIPNLNQHSIYGWCAALFNKKRLETHNLDIMSKEAFTKLFDRRDLSTLFCGYYGTLRLNLISSGERFLMRLLLYGKGRLQQLLNPILRLVLRDKGIESKRFSPFLLFIGFKIDRDDTGPAGQKD